MVFNLIVQLRNRDVEKCNFFFEAGLHTNILISYYLKRWRQSKAYELLGFQQYHEARYSLI